MNKRILFTIHLCFIMNIFTASFSLFNYNGEEAMIYSDSEMRPVELEDVNRLIKRQKDQLNDFFNKRLSQKPAVYFYSSVNSFEKNHSLDRHFGGLYQNGKITLQPFTVLKKNGVLWSMLSHEYTHFYADSFYTNLPFFIREGLASYLAGNKVREAEPLLYESIQNPSNFTNALDFEYYLYSSRNYIQYLLTQMKKKEFLGFLEKASPADIKSRYLDYYYADCDTVRVWINPRSEKRFVITFNGNCRVLEDNGLTNIYDNSIDIEHINNKLYLNNNESGNVSLYFKDGFSVDNGREKSRDYRGNLKIILSNQNIYLINLVPVEEYLYSVVKSEMPSASLEALKTQAVLSRSLVNYKKRLNRNELYDVLTLTSDQSYQGRGWETALSRRAVRETDKEALFYHNSMVYPYYSSTCAGHTALSADVWNKSLPYIKSVECGLSNKILCSLSPHFKDWEREITRDELSEIMNFTVNKFEIEQADPFGRVKYIKVNERSYLFDNLKSLTARKKGWAFLKSNLFTIRRSSDGLVYHIRGKGLGHGVGLCQYGAIELSKVKNYKEILKFYFNEVEVRRVHPEDDLYFQY